MFNNLTYSYKNKLIKKILLLSIALVSIVLLFWIVIAFIFTKNISIIGLITGNIAIENSSISVAGITNNNIKYSITAKTVKNYSDNQGSIELDYPIIKIVLENNEEFNITAEEGIFNRDSDNIKIAGNVSVVSSNGYVIYVDHVDFDYKNSLIYSTSVTIIESSELNMLAINGFAINNLTKAIQLNGPIEARTN